MGTRTIKLVGGPFDGREVSVGTEPEIRAYENMYGNIMATPPGGMPGTDSMDAYVILPGREEAQFVDPAKGRAG
jgi:hypothetical protein